MNEQRTNDILNLQEQIRIRLLEVGYADDVSAARLSRHLAEIAVLGEAFRQTTLPLFLSVDRENINALGQLAVSMKCDLEEMFDSISDTELDMRNLMDFFDLRR